MQKNLPFYLDTRRPRKSMVLLSRPKGGGGGGGGVKSTIFQGAMLSGENSLVQLSHEIMN